MLRKYDLSFDKKKILIFYVKLNVLGQILKTQLKNMQYSLIGFYSRRFQDYAIQIYIHLHHQLPIKPIG